MPAELPQHLLLKHIPLVVALDRLATLVHDRSSLVQLVPELCRWLHPLLDWLSVLSCPFACFVSAAKILWASEDFFPQGGTAIDTAACNAKTSAETLAGTAAEGAAGIDGVLLKSVVEMGVLLPLFLKTVLLNAA